MLFVAILHLVRQKVQRNTKKTLKNLILLIIAMHNVMNLLR